MCWRTSFKNENVRSLFSLAPGSQTAMDEPLWPVAFAPPPAPTPTAHAPLGWGRKIRGFAGGRSPPAKPPYFFSPSPTAQAPLGRGQGVGQKLQATKAHPSPSGYLAPG